ncbi:MAG: hypothetical protein QG657_4022 [Acidobacteriota bacterium]|nr:hypothetical protein [Acidobacteriota bacterium]
MRIILLVLLCWSLLFPQSGTTTLKNHPYDLFKEQNTEIYARIISFYLQMFDQTGKKEYLHKAIYFSETRNLHIYESIPGLPTPVKIRTFAELNIPLIRQKLKPGQAIIKYTLSKDDVYVFYIGKNSVDYRKLNITTSQLIDLVRRLTEPLDDFTRGGVDYLHVHFDLPLARQLYNILLGDFKRHRRQVAQGTIRELFIIPDRELFKLPFEALVTGFNRQDPEPGVVFSEYASAGYLIQDYAVSYYLSLFDFLEKTGKAPPAGAPMKKYTLSAFGSPTIRNTGKGFPREIPASRREILDIYAIFGKTEARIFLADLFDRKNFETFAPRSRVIHIATHLFNNIEQPQHSALVFSSPRGGGDTPVDYYYAYEVFKLKLDADLVVLSACESSEKHLEGLQGLMGMTASFRNAGARAMIVSMWPVDEYNSQLIPLFYRQYREGNPPATALRAAKLLFLGQTAVLVNGLKISFSHPFLWADYILYNFTGF